MTLTDTDIDRLTSVLVTKQDLEEMRTDVKSLKEIVRDLAVSTEIKPKF